jgi:hypothetical protein
VLVKVIVMAATAVVIGVVVVTSSIVLDLSRHYIVIARGGYVVAATIYSTDLYPELFNSFLHHFHCIHTHTSIHATGSGGSGSRGSD